jgi:hypothetical protein
MLDPKNIGPEQEQFEEFYPSDKPRTPANKRIQYDYRDASGKLFSTTAVSLDEARMRRDRWLQKVRNMPEIHPVLDRGYSFKRIAELEEAVEALLEAIDTIGNLDEYSKLAAAYHKGLVALGRAEENEEEQ